MASHPDHIKQYTAADFERYYAGQMTVQEMHALEKAALEDPFLADALEGYKFSPTPVSDVQKLKEQVGTSVTAFKTRGKQPQNRLIPIFRIAALFLLLAGAGWSIYYFTKTDDSTVAIQPKAQPKEKERKVTPPPTPSDNPSQAETLQSEPVIKQEALSKPPSRKKIMEHAEASRPVAEKKEEEHSEPALNRTTLVPQQAQAQTFIADSFVQATPEIETQATATENTFKGRVLDERNNPVPHAAITINNSKMGTVTDLNGNFSLKAPDSNLTATVNAIGYEASQLQLDKERDSLQVVLKPSQHALSEVVVTGYGKRTRNAAAKTTTEVGALEPAKGWSNFNDYIAQNLKLPDDLGARPSSNGEVRLSFDVNDKGEPVNIKVERSLCGECDREAIRLLQEGPKWKKKRGKKGTVTIRF